MKLLFSYLIFLVVVTAVGCDEQSQAKKDRSFENRLLTATAKRKTFQISDLTDFSWDRVLLFHPYTPADRIQRELGFDWQNSVVGQLESNDGFELLIFVERSNVVQFVRVRRIIADWDVGDKVDYKRGEDFFRVSKGPEKDGIILQPTEPNRN
jgi:hypothetical protein